MIQNLKLKKPTATSFEDNIRKSGFFYLLKLSLQFTSYFAQYLKISLADQHKVYKVPFVNSDNFFFVFILIMIFSHSFIEPLESYSF